MVVFSFYCWILLSLSEYTTISLFYCWWTFRLFSVLAYYVWCYYKHSRMYLWCMHTLISVGNIPTGRTAGSQGMFGFRRHWQDAPQSGFTNLRLTSAREVYENPRGSASSSAVGIFSVFHFRHLGWYAVARYSSDLNFYNDWGVWPAFPVFIGLLDTFFREISAGSHLWPNF